MIIKNLNNIICKSDKIKLVLKNLDDYKSININKIYGSVRSFLVSCVFTELKQSVVFIVPEEEEAEIMRDDLDEIIGNDVVSYLPDQKDRPYETIIIDSLRKSVYLNAIEKIATGDNRVVIVTAAALSKKIITHEKFLSDHISIRVGHTVNFEEFKRRLVNLGFVRENFVEDSGEMSIRGGIIDIFPFSNENPIRIEFFGNEIESIREFDLNSQRSFNKIQSLTIYQQFPEDHGQHNHDHYDSIIRYFNNDTVLFIEDIDHVNKILEDRFQEAVYQYERRKAKDEKIKNPQQLYLDQNSFERDISKFRRVNINPLMVGDTYSINLNTFAQERIGGNFKLLKEYLKDIQNLNQNSPEKSHLNTTFLCDSENQLERIESIMLDHNIPVESINLAVSSLNQGFVFPEVGLAVLTDNQFYGRSGRRVLRKRVFNGLSERQLNSLSHGDFVVHVDHGIGRYIGLKKIAVNNAEKECIMIRYQDNDLLYIPLEKMNRIKKYAAKEGTVPHISKLGTGEWEKLKSRTKKKVKDIARELIQLYAMRKAEEGFAFSNDTPWQAELEAIFEYEDTPDQAKATLEIKQDMEQKRPMDRLVCGDVGYGKTEVAIRAAFKAVNDNKQVAILVPTTILALQHYNTFTERMKNFPVKIEMLSRFRSRAEQKKVIEWLQSGKVDIIIGTHRLLSSDIVFKNLGLLIVDEEQRFGVRHKEKIKGLKTNVDILTMTATPIPRTLNMSLIGVRDMSLINTPPQGRLPIYTEVIPFDTHTIRAAILREFERGGQVFFVHNRVQTIYSMADLLRRLVPEVTFGVAHGQMDSNELERIMWEFAHKKFHCLIATMIIESGLDIPNVNTLIIDRADRFGLAQLYQLRGRVGRANNRAYAYLITPPIKNLTREAIKRLRAIEEFTELGSGFQIAMRDLQIRGAGNILGGEQSGFIVSLGFELYNKILEEAVQEIKSELDGETYADSKAAFEPKVEVEYDSYLPRDYISQDKERVGFYKTLVEINSIDELKDIAEEMVDRFGPLPIEAKNLINIIYIKIYSTRLKLKNVNINRKMFKAQFHDSFLEEDHEFQQQRIAAMVEKSKFPFTYYFTKKNKLGMKLSFDSDVRIKSNVLEFSKYFLQSLI